MPSETSPPAGWIRKTERQRDVLVELRPVRCECCPEPSKDRARAGRGFSFCSMSAARADQRRFGKTRFEPGGPVACYFRHHHRRVPNHDRVLRSSFSNNAANRRVRVHSIAVPRLAGAGPVPRLSSAMTR